MASGSVISIIETDSEVLRRPNNWNCDLGRAANKKETAFYTVSFQQITLINSPINL